MNTATHDLRLCDVTARKKGAEILFEVTEGLRGQFQHPKAKFYHITFVDDIGVTSDRTPEFRLCALKRKVDKAVRAMGLSALVFVEVQPLLNYPAGGLGRTLMLHAHALCWGEVSRRGFRNTKKKLNNSRSWQNQFGAEPVSSRLLGDFDAVLRIACYVAKLPHDGKYLIPWASGGVRFRPTLTGYPDRLALRIAEGLSHYSIFDAVFSVSDGKALRTEWKRRLVEWHRERVQHVEACAYFDVPRFWTRVMRSGSEYYSAGFVID